MNTQQLKEIIKSNTAVFTLRINNLIAKEQEMFEVHLTQLILKAFQPEPQPEEPSFQPEEPSFQPEEPSFQPEEPEEPSFQPEEPSFQPEEPETQSEEPETQSEEPEENPEKKTCNAILKSGKNKGKECGKIITSDFCSKHLKTPKTKTKTKNKTKTKPELSNPEVSDSDPELSDPEIPVNVYDDKTLEIKVIDGVEILTDGTLIYKKIDDEYEEIGEIKDEKCTYYK
jgi:hypothetical protein